MQMHFLFLSLSLTHTPLMQPLEVATKETPHFNNK